jgi:peptide/nickel transport system permease protein
MEGEHILGADHVGRDVLSRVIHGARISLTVMAISLSAGLIVGTSLGLLAGYFGGLFDEIIMRTVDIWMGFPFLLIALVVAVVLGSSFSIVMALLALLAWAAFVRNVRANVLVLREADYVDLARVAGASTNRILVRHMVPGIIGTVTVIASLSVGQLIMAEATLSFLGAGIPAPTPSWGSMISEGRDYLQRAWWTSVFPGLALFLTVMSLNFFGDWLRDRLDPRLRQI